MTVRDQHGLAISAASSEAARGYDAYVFEYLSYGSRLRELFAVADAAPDCALVNAHAAALHLAFEGAEGFAHAQPYLARMQAAAVGVTEREALFCEAVAKWAKRDFKGALDLLDELTKRWPSDLCALKWAQYHAFNLGDQPGLLRLGERVCVANHQTPYARGMVAFALEQNHRLEEAEEEGMSAVALAIDDAWAHHAVAHVLETQGRAKDGVKWMKKCAHTWERKGVFIRDHNWWHQALFHLNLDKKSDALSIFDERLWGAWPEFPQEQIGAVSMLWRLEMRGVEVGERWAPVVREARARADEHILPFHDLHYLYALSRAGAPGEGAAFLRSMKDYAEGLEGARATPWVEACIPCAEGVFAFAHGDYQNARHYLSAAMPKLHLIGGSHAQRHLFVEARDAASAGVKGAAH